MPYQDGELGQDEKAAITADLLLKQLRAGMDRSPKKTEDENVKIEASHISDEAMKLAQSEIVYGEPEEFENDNLDKQKLSKYVEFSNSDDEPADLESGNDGIDKEMLEDDQTVMTDEDDLNGEDNIEQVDDDSDPWYENEEEALAQTAVYEVPDDAEATEQEKAEIDKIIAEFDAGRAKSTAEDEAESEEYASSEGFLAQMATMIENGESVYEPTKGEADDFDFIEDILKNEEPVKAGEEMTLPPVSEDGSREYKGLDGAELDTTEINLLNLFKDKDELAEEYGQQRADEIVREGDKIQMPSAPKKKKFYELFDSDYEYIDEEQRDEIKSKYTAAFRGATVRFMLCLVFAIALLLFENAGMFGIKLPGLLTVSVYPTVCAMIDLQLVLLCALMYVDRLAVGFSSLFKFKPAFEAIPAVLLISSVVYTAIVTLIPGTRSAVFYNFPVALTFVLAILCEIMDLKREVMNFGIISSKSKKYAVRKLTEEERAQDAQLFEEYVSPDSPMFAVTRVKFVDGFFARIRNRGKNGHLLVLMLITLAEMLLAIGLGILMKASTYEIVTMAYLAVVLGLPGTVLIAGSHPFYRAVKNVYESESTVVGAGSLEEYSDGSVVFFDEKDIFPSTGVKINSVKVYSDNRIDGVIYYAASIFAKIGGPLSDVFSLATGEIGHSESTELVDVSDNGIQCTIDGESIYIGSNDYMKSMDFETPYGESDEVMEKNSGVRLMYVANEQEILAKFYVQYTADSEYELIFKQLYKAGMCVGIRTRDPNIDDAFVVRKLGLKSDYPVRVIHSKPGKEMPAKAERADSGVVSMGTVKPLLRALSLCDRIKYIARIHGIFEIVSTVLVMLVIYAVAALGKLGLGSAYAAMYQLFWLIPILFVAIFTE